MGLRIPVAVRLQTNRADVHVTRHLRNLQYRSTAVGGFASATLALDRPLSIDAPEIQPFGKVYVADCRHGGVLWEGNQEDAGKGVGSDGQVWEISALGPQARASDNTEPWIYFDKSLERFDRTPGADVQVNSQLDSSDTDDPSLVLSIGGGTSLTTGNYFGHTYTGINYTGQKVARYGFSWQAYGPEPGGVDYFVRSNAYATRLTTSANDSNTNVQFAGGTNSAGPFIIVTHITAGRTVVSFCIGVQGGPANAPAGMHMRVLDWYVLGTRYDRNGNEILTAGAYNNASPNIMQAHMIVEDVLGRLLPTYDGPNASIATNTYNIDQMTYPDGQTAAGILEDCMTLEPAYRWAAWESPSLVAGGRSRFVWDAWPSTIQYEASTVDGYSAPTSAADLFDSLLIRWVDVFRRVRSRVRTQTVQVLTDVGISRQGFLDLGEGIGSDNNAVQAGDAWLADHAVTSAGGTLTVARPILDRTAGRMVWPWELRPGGLVRIRGLAARGDSLVATAPDGAGVFRVRATTFDAESATATMELDTDPRTATQAIAALRKRQAAARK